MASYGLSKIIENSMPAPLKISTLSLLFLSLSISSKGQNILLNLIFVGGIIMCASRREMSGKQHF
jgi:hypothetical protein